jgi:hypothetical protein
MNEEKEEGNVVGWFVARVFLEFPHYITTYGE